MIIQCEKCATRFKVADDKVTLQGIKVRCSKCQHVFTARAPDRPPGSGGAKPPPSGIFAAPATRSPRSAPPSSGSVSVPQASLALSNPAFDPFAPPPPATAVPSPRPREAAPSPSFSFDDGEDPGSDRSFFGAPNQTIGGADDDDVPAPPPETPAPGFAPFEPAPRAPPAASVDPFAASLHGGVAGDPFAAPPNAPGDVTAAFVDPFAAPSGPSAPAAFPMGGDPFGAPVAPDPFASAPGPSAGAFGPPGADPFASAASSGWPSAAEEPPAPALPSSSSDDDPFAGLGVEVDDTYVVDDEPPAPPPAPAPSEAAAPSQPPSPPTPAVAKTATPAPDAPPSRRTRRRIPPAVPRVAWGVVQACILGGFLTLSLVWVRGGSASDIAEGNALEVVLGRASSHEGQGGLRVEDVVVRRWPVEIAPDLVVVSGYVVGGADAQPAVRVTVRFGDGAPAAAWANGTVDGVDLTSAESPEALLALNERVPDEPAVEAAARAPFVVLLRGAPDGAKAEVEVTSAASPAQTPTAKVTPPSADEGQGSKKLRRRSRKGEGGAGARLDAEAEPARARPKSKRAAREEG